MKSPLRRRSLRALVAVTAAATLAGPLTAGASTPTAASLIKAAKAAVKAQSGVHVVVRTTSGKTSTRVVVDIGASTGVEAISSGAKFVKITVTAADVFVAGNKSGLMTLMGLTAAQQKIVGTKAITVAAGSAPYNSFKASLTTPALVAFLPAVKGTTLAPLASGSGHYKLTWSSAATSTAAKVTSVLYLASSGATLPQSETTKSTTSSGSTVFSHWGETVNPSSPAKADQIAYSKVFSG